MQSKPRDVNSNTPLSPSELRETPSRRRDAHFATASPSHFAPSARKRHPESSRISSEAVAAKPAHSALAPSAPKGALEASSSRKVEEPAIADAKAFAAADVMFTLSRTRRRSKGADVARTAAATAAAPRSPIRLPSSCTSLTLAWSRIAGDRRHAPSAVMSHDATPRRSSAGHRRIALAAAAATRSPPPLLPMSSVVKEAGSASHTASTPFAPSDALGTDSTRRDTHASARSAAASAAPPSAPSAAPPTASVVRGVARLRRASARASATAPGTPNDVFDRSTTSLSGSSEGGTPFTVGKRFNVIVFDRSFVAVSAVSVGSPASGSTAGSLGSTSPPSARSTSRVFSAGTHGGSVTSSTATSAAASAARSAASSHFPIPKSGASAAAASKAVRSKAHAEARDAERAPASRIAPTGTASPPKSSVDTETRLLARTHAAATAAASSGAHECVLMVLSSADALPDSRRATSAAWTRARD